MVSDLFKLSCFSKLIHVRKPKYSKMNKLKEQRGKRARSVPLADRTTGLLSLLCLAALCFSSSTPRSRTACPKTEKQSRSPECVHARLVRLDSVTCGAIKGICSSFHSLLFSQISISVFTEVPVLHQRAV